jgi:nucleoid DNA-binding protein
LASSPVKRRRAANARDSATFFLAKKLEKLRKNPVHLIDNLESQESTTYTISAKSLRFYGKFSSHERQEFVMATKTSSEKPMSKTEILNALSESTGLSKKQVGGLFDELAKLISANLSKKGPGVFNVPGLMKILVKHKPATKARKGINPFTKEEVMIKAKPARNQVRIRPLKGLKDMV